MVTASELIKRLSALPPGTIVRVERPAPELSSLTGRIPHTNVGIVEHGFNGDTRCPVYILRSA